MQQSQGQKGHREPCIAHTGPSRRIDSHSPGPGGRESGSMSSGLLRRNRARSLPRAYSRHVSCAAARRGSGAAALMVCPGLEGLRRLLDPGAPLQPTAATAPPRARSAPRRPTRPCPAPSRRCCAACQKASPPPARHVRSDRTLGGRCGRAGRGAPSAAIARWSAPGTAAPQLWRGTIALTTSFADAMWWVGRSDTDQRSVRDTRRTGPAPAVRRILWINCDAACTRAQLDAACHNTWRAPSCAAAPLVPTDLWLCAFLTTAYPVHLSQPIRMTSSRSSCGC
jgi:hypothetical protein